jgi:D-threonate/D-erythronate kinase
MIVVLADDLSGAAELAGLAVRHGLRAEVQTEFLAKTEADVVCVDTNTRGLAPEDAAATVRKIARRIVDAKPEWIFKKCDSVLRGHVLVEARATAGVAGKSHILLLPGNPTRARVIRGGNYFVGGVLLHDTAFAHDPEFPRMTSRVSELLQSDGSNVFTPDIESLDDVMRHALAVDDATLPVGAADFFQALLEIRVSVRPPRTPRVAARRPTEGPSMLVCGSRASWAARQREAMALGVPVFTMHCQVDAAVRSILSTGHILIGVGDGPANEGNAPAALANRLAGAVAEILHRTMIARVLSEGGATSAALMHAMKWTRFEATEVAAEGVAVLCCINAPAPELVIKPGSYAWPKELWPPKQR